MSVDGWYHLALGLDGRPGATEGRPFLGSVCGRLDAGNLRKGRFIWGVADFLRQGSLYPRPRCPVCLRIAKSRRGGFVRGVASLFGAGLGWRLPAVLTNRFAASASASRTRG